MTKNILINTDKGFEIFAHYVPKIREQGISKNFKAVFRDDDKTPSANIYFNKKQDQYYYKDFGCESHHFNAIEFVKKIENCDFKEAIQIIEEKILHNYSGFNKNTNNIPDNKFSKVDVEPIDDYVYWEKFTEKTHFSSIARKYNMLSLKSFSYIKNKKEFQTKSNPNDPIFAFKIAEDCYKIYRPNLANFKHLWIGNKPSDYKNVFGIEQLPDFCETIIIVEGYKDTIVANANGFNAVGVDSASTIIDEGIISTLKNKCDNLILIYDNDNAGKIGSEKNAKKHGLISFELSKKLIGTNGKDISDYFSHGNDAETLKKQISEYIKDYSPKKPEKLSKFEQVEVFLNQHYDIRYNEVSNQIESRLIKENTPNYTTLNENNVFRFLQHNNISFSIANLTSLLKSDYVKQYNPFKTYFENLNNWNEQKDVDYIDKLTDYIYVLDDDKNRFKTQFKKCLVRTVACAIDDSVVNKQVFVFVHEEQNSGKTTLIRWLCPPELKHYIAENISIDKDSLIAMCENFIINMDELATLSKAEINSLKSVLSKDVVKIRRPYDRTPSFAPRRASLFGSTNKTEFLNDETGNVRWLCFELKSKINWDYKKDLNIDDIWRQAYTLYLSGFNYELTPNEITENELANRNFMVRTLEMELIQKYYEVGSKDDSKSNFLTSSDIVENFKLLGITGATNVNNIGKALKVLGYKKESVRNHKGNAYPIKGYYVINKEM